MYRNQRRIVTLTCLLLFFHLAYAQFFPLKNYPQQYFQWPAGAKIALAANFGELRPNHYHMGLDCKTDQKVNVPVYAAAAGYVSRVKIEPLKSYLQNGKSHFKGRKNIPKNVPLK